MLRRGETNHKKKNYAPSRVSVRWPSAHDSNRLPYFFVSSRLELSGVSCLVLPRLYLFGLLPWRAHRTASRAKGIIFVPASGRSKAGMFSAMEELGEELKRDGAPFICMNGLTVSSRSSCDAVFDDDDLRRTFPRF